MSILVDEVQDAWVENGKVFVRSRQGKVESIATLESLLMSRKGECQDECRTACRKEKDDG